MHHDAHGYWLREAGGAEPVAPAVGDIDADVVVLGGGYTGMWTAWHLRERAPDCRVVVLEADVCGHGPSGRWRPAKRRRPACERSASGARPRESTPGTRGAAT